MRFSLKKTYPHGTNNTSKWWQAKEIKYLIDVAQQ
jgi:hypothetical protein